LAYWLRCHSCGQWSKSHSHQTDDSSCLFCNKPFVRFKSLIDPIQDNKIVDIIKNLIKTDNQPHSNKKSASIPNTTTNVEKPDTWKNVEKPDALKNPKPEPPSIDEKTEAPLTIDNRKIEEDNPIPASEGIQMTEEDNPPSLALDYKDTDEGNPTPLPLNNQNAEEDNPIPAAEDNQDTGTPLALDNQNTEEDNPIPAAEVNQDTGESNSVPLALENQDVGEENPITAAEANQDTGECNPAPLALDNQDAEEDISISPAGTNQSDITEDKQIPESNQETYYQDSIDDNQEMDAKIEPLINISYVDKTPQTENPQLPQSSEITPDNSIITGLSQPEEEPAKLETPEVPPLEDNPGEILTTTKGTPKTNKPSSKKPKMTRTYEPYLKVKRRAKNSR
jgi:hypothetical protein